MGYLKASEFDSLRGVPSDVRGEILCRFLKYKESLMSIGEALFDGEGTQASQRPSQVTRSFGFSGRNNAGKYSHVPEAAFYDFAAEFKPENTGSGLADGTFDRWLKDWYARQGDDDEDYEDEDDYEEDEPVFIPTPRPNPQPVPRPTPSPRPMPPVGGGGGAPQREKVYVNTGSGSGSFSPILLLVIVCVLLWGGSKVMDFGRGAIFSGKQMLGNVNNFLSAEYNAESFEFEGKQYAGNRRFNEPAGACMRFDGGMDYTLGYFDGSDLDGYGITVREDGEDLQAGVFKENKLNGWAILRCDGIDYVAKFKKGIANGYGYCYYNGTEQFVKFKDADSAWINFRATELVAERQGDTWVKPNGKPLKLKDNTYKGIEWIREGLISIGDVEYFFDVEVHEAYYDGPDTRLSWDNEGCEYDSILDDEEGTWLYHTTGEKLEGRHQYKAKDGLHWNTFDMTITVD